MAFDYQSHMTILVQSGDSDQVVADYRDTVSPTTRETEGLQLDRTPIISTVAT